MVDDSNMGRIEAMFYEQLEALNIKPSGKLRRYDSPTESGAVKEMSMTLTYEDGVKRVITLPYDLDCYSSIIKFAKERA